MKLSLTPLGASPPLFGLAFHVRAGGLELEPSKPPPTWSTSSPPGPERESALKLVPRRGGVE